MLKIEVLGGELYDEEHERFISIKPTTITLEHSLIAISKWESKYHIPFLEEGEKTKEQIQYYIECMTITPNVDPNVFNFMPSWQVEEIMEYVRDPMTATWFSDDANGRAGKTRQKEVVTSELIYYWMIALNIPADYEKWHINRLLTLIQVCNVKNASNDKKMSNKEILQNNDAINAARRAKLHTRG